MSTSAPLQGSTGPARRMSPRHKRMAWIALGLAVLATAIGLVLYALSSTR